MNLRRVSPNLLAAQKWRHLGMYFSALILSIFVSSPTSAAIIGWQTFTPATAGNNNSGINDSTPDSNSTYDATPVGSIGPNNTYLTGAIGPNASALGRKGRGQNATNSILNGPGFGNEAGNSNRLITNTTLANGTPGMRIGPNGGSGTSTWKFSTSDNERQGDIRITNESDYFFRPTFLHFDARLGNANSPNTLSIGYLNGDGTAFDNGLTRLDNGNELVNLSPAYNNTFTFVPNAQTFNISHSLGGAFSTQLFLAPGDSAAFRLTWSGQGGSGAETQMDNIAFEGQFFETAALMNEIDPATVPEPNGGLLAIGLFGFVFLRRRK